MRTFFIASLLIIPLLANASITLSPGDTFNFEFNGLDLIQANNGFSSQEAVFAFESISGPETIETIDLINLNISLYEDGIAEGPFFTDEITSLGLPGRHSYHFNNISHWDDLQGIIQLDYSGPLETPSFILDEIFVNIVTNGAEYEGRFSVVPEPSSYALIVGLLTVFLLFSKRRISNFCFKIR